MDQEQTDLQFNASVARMLHREALRRAAREMNSTSGPGLEAILARISADATAEAAERIVDHATAVPDNKPADVTPTGPHANAIRHAGR
jgi:hypothetical protein